MPKKRCDGTIGLSENRWCNGCCQNQQNARHYNDREKCSGPLPICQGKRSNSIWPVSVRFTKPTLCSAVDTATKTASQAKYPEPKRMRIASAKYEPELLEPARGGRTYVPIVYCAPVAAIEELTVTYVHITITSVHIRANKRIFLFHSRL